MKKLLFILILLSLNALAENRRGGSVEPGKDTSVINDKVGDTFRHTSASRSYGNRDRVAKATAAAALTSYEACTKDNTPICDVIAAEPAEHLKFGISFIKKVKSSTKTAAGPSNCDCLSEKLQGSQTKDDFDKAKEDERKVVNQVILKSYGKKFVNQFTANLEDMYFFLKQTSSMFTNQGPAIEAQCFYPDKYNTKVQETCDKNNFKDQVKIEDRKDLFIKALSNKVGVFNDLMPAMASDVFDQKKEDDLYSNESESDKDVTFKLMVRSEYDQLRMDRAIRHPQAKFMDGLINTILKVETYNNELNEVLKSNPDPYLALLKVISDNAADLVVTDENMAYVKDASTIKSSLNFLMLLHPGVSLAFSDPNAFANVRKVVKPGSSETFVNTLNNHKNVLEPILIDRCNTMIEEFAKAVCTKDDDIIASVDPDDLEILLHDDGETHEAPAVPPAPAKKPELHDLLICESRALRQKKTAGELGTFVGIVGNDGRSVRDSDYTVAHTSKATGLAVGGTIMSQISVAAANDSSLRSEIGDAIDRNNQTKKSFTGPGILGDKVLAEQIIKDRVMTFGSSPMSKDEARKIIADNKKWEATRSSEMAGNGSTQKPNQVAANESDPKMQAGTQTSSQSQNFVTPQTNSMMAPNYSNVQTPTSSSVSNQAAAQSRDQLRQYLAQKNDPVETTKVVTALDDSSVQELNKLRNERQSLLEQQLKDGESRLKELRSELSNTASKVKAPVADKNIASVDENQDNAVFERSSGRSPASIDPRPSFGGGPVSSSSGVASTGGSKSSSVVSSNKVSKESSDAEAQINASSKVQSLQTDSSGSIVITSAGVKSSESLPAQELNQEVQKFLAGTDLMATSIDDIKSKGIKIRFNVMENNKLVQKEVVVKYDGLDQETRNQIDLKFARNNVKNQVSKLAVLRMLIKQNKTL